MADNAQSVLRRLRELYNNPRLSIEQIADTIQNFNKGRRAEINDQGAGYRTLTPKERTAQIVGGALENIGGGGMGALGVIKSKGGNWLSGSVENALNELKRQAGARGLPAEQIMAEMERVYNPESLATLSPETRAHVERIFSELRPKVALNKWIEGPLTKYVKRDMATPEDPVRKLAEQGILHFQPNVSPSMQGTARANRRMADSFVREPQLNSPGSVLGSSDLARQWEDITDSLITPIPGKEALQRSPKDQAWLEKLGWDTPVHEYDDMFSDIPTGFNHLTDELANALNPESGLPRNLLLTPEQMQQMGMEKAVRHVADINAWRAAQQAEADLARSQSPAVSLFKEYAENNPKGLRWVELKAPENTNPAYLGQGKYEDEMANLLADQLKYEGDTMGHCVGGYCSDVLEGRSRIFSLRDAKGQPHVTIETQPVKQSMSGYNKKINDAIRELYPEASAKYSSHGDKNIAFYNVTPPVDEWGSELIRYSPDRGKIEVPEHVKKMLDKIEADTGIPVSSFGYNPAMGSAPPSAYLTLDKPNLNTEKIIQIKGKQNLAPKEDYLPFVRDFVKSGKWSDVGDLRNAGLRKTSDALNRMEIEKLKSLGIEDVPDYVTGTDLQKFADALGSKLKYDDMGNIVADGYARGGLVERSAWRPMEIDGIMAFINE